MKRSKKLYAMLGVLALVCVAALIASTVKERKENIAVSGENLLAIPVESVQAFRWEENGEAPLAFHRSGERWVYDDDEDFPASVDKVDALLEQFEAFGVGFTIEDAENPGDYGLADPVAVLTLETADGTKTLELGAFSKMDDQRYLSVGDGNVYLAVHDPYEEFSNASLRSLIADDQVPAMDQVQQLTFTGAEAYQARRVDEGTFLRKDDIWAVEQDGSNIALDPDLVKAYLDLFTGSLLVNYADYHAESDDLPAYGLDAPELTVEVQQKEDPFTLHIGLDPEEKKAWDKMSDKEREDADPVTAYAQVEGSHIVYELLAKDYEGLAACAVNDLRHKEVLPAPLEDVRKLEATVDGETCVLTVRPEQEDLRWEYKGEKVHAYDLEDALRTLRITDFGDFPSGEQELVFTVQLASKEEIQVALYRYDGDSCVAAVDGRTLGLVDRPDAMDLVENLRTIVLNQK